MLFNVINNFKKFITIATLGLFFILPSLQVFAAPLENGMPASNVLGQSDFITSTQQRNTTGLNVPVGIIVDEVNNRTYITDRDNDRVLVYDTTTITDGMAAWRVLGTDGFASTWSLAVTQNSLGNPMGLALDVANNRLFVSQRSSNRISVFDVATIDNGENAIYVLGQDDFISANPNKNAGTPIASGLSRPEDITYDSVHNLLYVADTSNNRVVIYDVASITDGEDAINVLGKSSFTAIESLGATAGNLLQPSGLALDSGGDRLFVSAYGQNRVLVFNVASITDGEYAINVLGQSDFITGSEPSISASSMVRPMGLDYDQESGYLFVHSTSSPRVLVFDASLITDNESAIYVLGQPDMISSGLNYGGALVSDGRGGFRTQASQTGLSNSYAGLYFDSTNDLLYVADSGNNRVLIFDLSEPAPVPSLSYSGSFTESVANDGSLDGSIIITLTDDTFDNAISLTLNTHYTLTNTPAGLTPVMTIDGGTTATLTFTGNATDHEDINDVTNLTITFLDGAFTTTATASDVTNYEYTTGSIDFDDAVVEEEEEEPTRSSSGGRASASTLAQLGITLNQSEATIQSLMKQIVDLQTLLRTLQEPSTTSSDLVCIPSLKIGSTGDMVKTLQSKLGILSDGQFGPQTEQSVKAFQKLNNLMEDGVVGKNTCDALN